MIKVPFNDMYLVNAKGKVYSSKSHRFLKGRLINGMRVVDIKHPDKKSNCISLARLVYHVFVKEIDLLDDSYIIIHKNKNPEDFDAKNLKLITRQQAMINTRNICKQQMNVGRRSKLEAHVYDIQKKLKKGKTYAALAAEYNVSATSVSRIVKKYNLINH